jgi:hypothetical protein
MKAGLSAAYSIFILAVTTVAVVSLLNFIVNSVASPTFLDWLAVIGLMILIYILGIVVSFAGLRAIDKLVN